MNSSSRGWTSAAEAGEAIRTMLVRGAPLIGATAAYGVALADARRSLPMPALDLAYRC